MTFEQKLDHYIHEQMQRKAADPDRWLRGMRRWQGGLDGGA